MAFSEVNVYNEPSVIISGCNDCPLNINATPRNYCFLTKSVIDTIDKYKNRELSHGYLQNCPIDPTLTIKIKIFHHSYSGVVCEI